MARRSIHSYLEVASGLGDLTKSKAKEAATELLALSANPPSPKKIGKQAGKLAEDLMTSAESNRKMITTLIRTEVDKAVSRLDLANLSKDVQGVVATVAGLAAQLEELGETVRDMATGGSKPAASAARAAAPAAPAAPAAAPAAIDAAVQTTIDGLKATAATMTAEQKTAAVASVRTAAEAAAKTAGGDDAAVKAAGDAAEAAAKAALGL